MGDNIAMALLILICIGHAYLSSLSNYQIACLTAAAYFVAVVFPSIQNRKEADQ